jgi:hypothetical protein
MTNVDYQTILGQLAINLKLRRKLFGSIQYCVPDYLARWFGKEGGDRSHCNGWTV